jgi:uncharacterized protein (DUF362 family)/Pyruvate/2-oxoacid:ferredoxin oxidoreductase delta subunit
MYIGISCQKRGGLVLPEKNVDTVALVRCRRYDPDEVYNSLKELFDHCGGLAEMVRPGQKVLLKPNLLAAAKPTEAVTTHPAIIKALSLMLIELGAEVLVGDSPGNDKTETALRVSGLLEAAEEVGAKTVNFTQGENKEFIGFKKRMLPLAAELNQVDLVFNVGKLKTHSLTGLTGAVKNIYGCVVGRQKARYHLEHPLPSDFSRLLLDVYLAVKPVFSIIDAVIAMEGPGPRRGRPRQLGLLMASKNAIALDNVAAAITGFDTDQVTTLAAAKEVLLSGVDLAAIDIKGLTLEECRVTDFDRGPAASGKITGLLTRFPFAWLRNLLENRRPYPHINTLNCNGCGVCFEHCPARVISFCGDIPDIDLKQCIRCYCCAEFCSQGAIDLK